MDAVLQGREIGAADQIGLGRHGVDEIVGGASSALVKSSRT